jgi:hypothetical protein
MYPVARFLLVVVAFFACGGGSGDAGTPSSGGALTSYRPCAADKRVGHFSIALQPTTTTVEGAVESGVAPGARDVKSQEGACKLLVGRQQSCATPCAGDSLCGEGGRCVPIPVRENVGTVKVTGLRAPLSLEPSSLNYYSAASSPLPHPGFAAGDAITLEVSAGRLGPFTLRGRGVEPLELTAGELLVQSGKGLTVTWRAPAQPQEATALHIKLDIGRHGGIQAALECDGVPDTGSFTIPAALVTGLVGEGSAGFPEIAVTRRSVDSIERGCVELQVASPVKADVTVFGAPPSCSVDEDCAAGKTCLANLTCG